MVSSWMDTMSVNDIYTPVIALSLLLVASYRGIAEREPVTATYEKDFSPHMRVCDSFRCELAWRFASSFITRRALYDGRR